jgi:protease IV
MDASRRRLIGIGVLVIIVVAALVLVVAPPATDDDRAEGDAVAVIHLAGPIQEGASGPFAAGMISPSMVRERLEQAEQHPRVQAVVLRVDSPGGAVASSQEITALIRDAELPVVVSMGDTAASGGYYIATGADRVVAHPGTTTGSIGVIWAFLDISELLAELGVEIDAVTSGEHKDMTLPGRLTDERREIIQEMSDRMYEDFVEAVAEGRDLPEEEVRALATGQPYTGEQAFELGLVDVLGGLDEAVAEAAELAGIEDPAVVEVRPGLFEQLFGGSGLRTGLRDLLRDPTRLDEVLQVQELVERMSTPRYELR